MSADQKTHRKAKHGKQKPKQTTKQVAVVGVLVAVLAVALLTGPEPAEDAVTSPSELKITELPVEPLPPATVAEPHPAFVRIQDLPSVELNHWVGLDPFAAAPVEVEEMESPEPAEPIAELEQREWDVVEVQAVYRRGGEAVALIGGSVVRVGEALPDGRRVISVTANGVELAP